MGDKQVIPRFGWWPLVSFDIEPEEQTLYRGGQAVGRVKQRPDGRWQAIAGDVLLDVAFTRENAIALVEGHFNLKSNPKKVTP